MQRIENVRDILRPAFPKGRLLECVANRLHKSDILLALIPALYGRVLMSGLYGHIAVGRPVPCETIATSLRAAGAVRKDDDRVLPRIIGIKDPHVQVFVPLRIMEDEVFNLGNRVGTGLQLVTARFRRRRKRSSWRDIRRRMLSSRRLNFHLGSRFPSGKTRAASGTSDE